ncbi:neck protein [Synechococcus phage S-PM2]|uniref:Neck protein n=1 Tax=Synechococcus phage S-PM2 TaxID=238854 RepID=Q5GQV9_BPSYP|nr:head closure Hc2 [Synechococcus phage S-PM2]CAF34158.1 neck protein [Synechococcus phage S-PM2]CFW42233.1 neck protein [Synechococcus phage S-PM2]
MPTSPYFPSYYSGYSGEQNLVQDLVDEQIKLFGTDIYYLPRTILRDNTLDDVIYNKFERQFQVEMLLQNVEGFGSPSEFISKFGLRITDEVRFIVSQRRWDEEAVNYDLNVNGRPNEGDLLYFPLTQDIYEIKFVEREDPFYQLGKNYFYIMTAEIYEYGSDNISTGVEEIDELETLFSSAIAIALSIGGTGDFDLGEIVTGGISGTEAEVKSWDSSSRILQVINRTGTFEEGESVTGNDSGSVWVVDSFDTLNNTNSEYDQNREIESTADTIIDWSESNPFGEYGNFTGSI